MINYHAQLVEALGAILPTHYELQLHSGTEVPCISYMELGNADDVTGETLGYSILSYQVKVWGHSLQMLQHYAQQVDAAMRPLGFKRAACIELFDNNSTLIQKVMTYEAMGLENY